METGVRASEAGLKFPVLGISADQDLWGFPDLRSLETCGRLTLRDKMQDGMELISADGRRWRVDGVRKLGRAGSVVSQVLAVLLSGGPQFRIEHDLTPLTRLSLREVQERACAAISAHPDFWPDEDGHLGSTPAELAKVRRTRSIAEIYDILGLDTFEAY